MNQEKIKQSALVLQDLLSKYAAVNPEASALKRSLDRYLDAAVTGQITTALQWGDLPGAYLFMEGSLGNYRDLEHAFAVFRTEVTDTAEFASRVMKGIGSES